MSDMHVDAIDPVIFKRQLEYVKSQTYDEKLADLPLFQGDLPISSEVPEGATEMTWRSFKGIGAAKFISDYDQGFPRADIGGAELTRKVYDIGMGYGYSLKEIARAAKANIQLDTKRSAAAKRAVEEKLNAVALTGDTDRNIPGFISYPGVQEYTVPTTGTGTTKTWSTKTADQILVDLYGILNTIVEGTNGIERPNTIKMPLASYNYIKQTPRSTLSDKTILQFFLENNPGVSVGWWNELKTAGAGSTKRMIAYVNDADHLSVEIPVTLKQHPEYQDGPLSYFIPMTAETVGTIVYYPLSVAFADGI